MSPRSGSLVEVCTLGKDSALGACGEQLPQIIEHGLLEEQPVIDMPQWLRDLLTQCSEEGIFVLDGDLVSFEPSPSHDQCMRWAMQNMPMERWKSSGDFAGFVQCRMDAFSSYLDCVVTEIDDGNPGGAADACIEDFVWDDMMCWENHYNNL